MKLDQLKAAELKNADGTLSCTKAASAIHMSMVASNALREWKEKDIVKPETLNAQNKAFLAELAELGGDVDAALSATLKKTDESLKSMDSKSAKAISDVMAKTTTREFLLKDESDKNISSLEFHLSGTDIKFEDVESFEIIATSLNATGNCQFRLHPKNYQKSNISGYMGYLSHYEYGSGSQSLSASHNSNQGFIWFPTSISVAQSQYGYYGNGVNARVKIPVNARTNAGGYKSTGTVDYEMDGWTTSCSTYPNNERGRWSNNSSNQGWNQDIHGFTLYPTSGALHNGTVIVRVHLKPKKVGA